MPLFLLQLQLASACQDFSIMDDLDTRRETERRI
jgi:hypothetical protein